jgi:hypothetical protein
VEKNAYGAGVISNLKRNFGIPVQAVWQSTDKTTRAKDIISYCVSGFVYIPREAEWLSDFIAELETFPNAQHDDQVDVVTGSISALLGGNTGNMLYERFDSSFNVAEIAYNPALPLYICYSAINQPAAIFAQFNNGQLKILESIVSINNDRDTFITQIKAKQANDYRESVNKFFLLCHSEGRKLFSPFDFSTLLQKEYGKFPEFYNLDQKLNDVVELVSKALVDVVFDYSTNKRESKILINPRCDTLIKALEGGLNYNEVQTQGLKKQKKVIEQYPYTNIGNCLHQLAYNVFTSQEYEGSKEYKLARPKIIITKK